MSTLRFSLRTDKKDKQGLIPIELVYQIPKKERAYHRLSKKIRLANWDPEEQKAQVISKRAAKDLFPDEDGDRLLSDSEVNTINHEILSITTEIERIEKKFFLQGKSPEGPDGYSPREVMAKLSGKPVHLVVDLKNKENMEVLINKMLAEKEKKIQLVSQQTYKNLKRLLRGFYDLGNETGPTSLFMDAIDEEFVVNFKHYITTDGKLGNIAAAKILRTLKTVLLYAQRKRIEFPLTDFKEFSIKNPELEIISLTKNELDTIYALDLSGNSTLGAARDILIFSCVTGLRYQSMAELEHTDVYDDHIEIAQKKLKESDPVWIPITPYSKAILKKYKGTPRPLPSHKLNGQWKIMTNARVNLYLKEIGKLAGMKEKKKIVRYYGIERKVTVHEKWELLTCHVGRKTFCSLGLELGMPMESVMAISGHRDIRTFKNRYVKVRNEYKKDVMTTAFVIEKPAKKGKAAK